METFTVSSKTNKLLNIMRDLQALDNRMYDFIREECGELTELVEQLYEKQCEAFRPAFEYVSNKIADEVKENITRTNVSEI